MNELVIKSPKDLINMRSSLDSHYKLDRRESDNWNISLDKNPTNKSPESLYLKLYILQEYLNRSTAMYSKYMRFYIAAKNIKIRIEEEFNSKLNIAFSNNVEDLKQFRSTEEKVRYCQGLLDQDIVLMKENAFLFFEEVSGYYSYFKAKHNFLSSINGNILTQLGILKLMFSVKDVPVMSNTHEEEYDKDLLDSLSMEGNVNF